MNDNEAEALKGLRDTLDTAEDRLFDHLNATFRWIMATLFAANGGAILGLLGWSEVTKHGGLSALGWFAGGVVLSIFMGISITVGTLRDIYPLINSKAAIEQSLLTRVLPTAELFNEMATSTRPTWKTWLPYYPGGLSFLCLIVGMLVVACRL